MSTKKLTSRCQIYKYSFCRDKNVISTKIQYEMGYCYEGVEINCMSQIYYSLSKNDYYKVKNIVDLWKEVISLGENVRQIVSDSLANKAMELFSKIHDKLRKISNIGDIQNREFTEYRLLYLLLIIFGEGYGNIIPSGYILGDKNRDIEDYLLNKKRTGILGSILLEDIFIFSHTGQSPKNGRVYISFPIEAFSIDYIVLCAVPKRNLSDTQEINKELKVLQCDFIKRLKKKINL